MAAGATSPKRCLSPLLVGQSGRQGGDMVCWQSRQVPNKDVKSLLHFLFFWKSIFELRPPDVLETSWKVGLQHERVERLPSTR